MKRMQRTREQVTDKMPPNDLMPVSLVPMPQPSEKVDFISTLPNDCGSTPVAGASSVLNLLIKNQTAAARSLVGRQQVADYLQLYERQAQKLLFNHAFEILASEPGPHI